MARALWSGAISFGLINVPVKLYKATASGSARGISFHQIHAACGTRINMVRRCPTCERDVPWEEIVKGYEFERGRYAIVREEDLAALPQEDKAAIAIEDFVEANEVDPLLFDRAYWIAPEGTPRAYSLLHQALVETGRVAVARMMLRTKSHLALVRPDQRHLVLETMYWADEVVAADEVPGVDEKKPVPPREAEMAKKLIDAMTVRFDLAKYRDTYTDALREVIEKKIEGREVAESPLAAPSPTKVIDIMEALRRSVEAAQRGAPAASRGKGEAAEEPAARRAPARSSKPRAARSRSGHRKAG